MIQLLNRFNQFIATNYLGRITYHLAIFLCVCLSFISFIKSNYNTLEHANFDRMVEFNAHPPYVFRNFVPQVSKALASQTSPNFIEVFSSKYNEIIHSKLSANIGLNGLSSNYPLTHTIALFLLFLMLYACTYYSRQLFNQTSTLLLAPKKYSVFIPFLFILGLPTLMSHDYSNYIYDISTLFFTLLSFNLILQNYVYRFVLIFIFAAFNKETSVMLIPLALMNFSLKPSKKISLFIILALFYTLARLLLLHHYQGPENLPAWEFNLLRYGLKVLTTIYSLPELLSFILVFTGILLFWDRKHLYLRQGFLLFFVPFAVLQLFFGIPNEIRVYYEIYPLVLCLLAQTFFFLIEKAEGASC